MTNEPSLDELESMCVIHDKKLAEGLTALRKEGVHVQCLHDYVVMNEFTNHDLKAFALHLLAGINFLRGLNKCAHHS